jgi:hypothetical protein
MSLDNETIRALANAVTENNDVIAKALHSNVQP